jgi:hypothetical protein
VRQRCGAVTGALRASRTGGAVSRRSSILRLAAIERGERAVAYAIDRPRRVLAIGLAVAILGFALDTQTEVVSDVRELVPQDLQALKDVNELQREC